MPTLWSRSQTLVSQRMCMPGTTSVRNKDLQWSCLSSGWLLRVCKMESSLRRLMWSVCKYMVAQGKPIVHIRQVFRAKCCSFTVPYSGHLASPAGRSSVVVKVPTLEWTLSPWFSYLIVDRDSANQPMQHALKKCEPEYLLVSVRRHVSYHC